jgi:hypothetical protein
LRNKSDAVALQHAEVLFSIVVTNAKSVSETERMVCPKCRRLALVVADWLRRRSLSFICRTGVAACLLWQLAKELNDHTFGNDLRPPSRGWVSPGILGLEMANNMLLDLDLD